MSNDPNSIDQRHYILDLGGQQLNGLVLDGDALTSTPLYEGTPDVEGTGGEVCFGAASGESETLTFRALPGSSADRILSRALRSGTCTYFAVRRIGHTLTEATYFSTQARVRSSTSGRIKLSTNKDPIEYTMTVVNPIDNDLRTTLNNIGGALSGAINAGAALAT